MTGGTMGALLRIELISTDTEIELETSGASSRKYKVLGPDHLTVELEKVDDTLTIKLKRVMPGLFDAPAHEVMDPACSLLQPQKPSPKAGVYEPDGRGIMIFKGPLGTKKKHYIE